MLVSSTCPPPAISFSKLPRLSVVCHITPSFEIVISASLIKLLSSRAPRLLLAVNMADSQPPVDQSHPPLVHSCGQHPDTSLSHVAETSDNMVNSRDHQSLPPSSNVFETTDNMVHSRGHQSASSPSSYVSETSDDMVHSRGHLPPQCSDDDSGVVTQSRPPVVLSFSSISAANVSSTEMAKAGQIPLFGVGDEASPASPASATPAPAPPVSTPQVPAPQVLATPAPTPAASDSRPQQAPEVVVRKRRQLVNHNVFAWRNNIPRNPDLSHRMDYFRLLPVLAYPKPEKPKQAKQADQDVRTSGTEEKSDVIKEFVKDAEKSCSELHDLDHKPETSKQVNIQEAGVLMDLENADLVLEDVRDVSLPSSRHSLPFDGMEDERAPPKIAPAADLRGIHQEASSINTLPPGASADVMAASSLMIDAITTALQQEGQCTTAQLRKVCCDVWDRRNLEIVQFDRWFYPWLWRQTWISPCTCDGEVVTSWQLSVHNSG